MGKWHSGKFIPKNPQKYLGDLEKGPVWRSSWELTFMNVCDNHPNIIGWGSEVIQIPYINPLKPKNKQNSIYIPDFLIVYIDKKGKKHAEVLEIKPLKEALLEKAKSKHDKLMVLVNTYKWKAAELWCKKNNMTFRIMTEEQLYKQHGKK